MSETQNPEQIAKDLKVQNEKFASDLSEAKAQIKSLEEAKASQAELIESKAKAIEDLTVTVKELDETQKAQKVLLTKAQNREAVAGVTEKNLANFNASRRAKGMEAVDVDGAIAYTEAFETSQTSKGEREYRLKHLSDAAKVHLAAIEKNLGEGGGNDSGGTLVPPAFASDIEQAIRNENDFMAHCRTINLASQTGGKEVQRFFNGKTSTAWNDLDSLTAQGNSGGPRSLKKDFRVKTLIAVQPVSMDLFETAGFSVSEYLTEPVAMDMALAIEEAFIGDGTASGDAANEPERLVVNSNIANTNPRNNGELDATSDNDNFFGKFKSVDSGTATDIVQSSTVDVSNTLGRMPAMLKAGYRRGGRWFMNPMTLAKIALLKDTQGAYILRMSQTSNSSDPLTQMLYGYPVSICESFPGIAANSNPLCFGNMNRGYTIVYQRGMEMLIDRTSQYPTRRFLFSQRIGGGTFDPNALIFMTVAA